jgi:hypothetical protein
MSGQTDYKHKTNQHLAYEVTTDKTQDYNQENSTASHRLVHK